MSTKDEQVERETWTLPGSRTIRVVQNTLRGGSRPKEIDTLMSELGMPENAIWRRFKGSGDVYGQDWKDYEIELFGMLVEPPDSPEVSWPQWSIDGGQKEVVQLWRQRVTHQRSPIVGEIRWSPDRGKVVSLTGLENSHTVKDIQIARKGLALLETIVKSLGRPLGSTEMTLEDFRHESVRRCRLWMDKHDGKCTILVLAGELGISPSQFHVYSKESGLNIKAIKNLASSRTAS